VGAEDWIPTHCAKGTTSVCACTCPCYHIRMHFRMLLLPLLCSVLLAQNRPSSCKDCPTWNIPQQPFKIYGNTYYVGTHGLGSVLITSQMGHVLIDGALPESVPQIVANIRSLGFRAEDLKLIVNSHVHFDHAGGIAELQKLSGAQVAASQWTADVMERGTVPHDDPQFGVIIPIARVAHVEIVKDNEIMGAGAVTVTAHLTPGHTPGGTSWTWQSCENRCLNLVYADSLTPVSADGFLFSRSKDYPHAVEDFERSYSFLNSTPCDILITPHPDFSDLWQRLERRNSNAEALIDPKACRVLAERSREALEKRLAIERGR
jgi:metallo-beta-lactamase class B